MRTSTPSSAPPTVACTGTPSASPPSASPRSRPAAERATAQRSVRSGASRTAGTSARPAQPVAPAMHTDRPAIYVPREVPYSSWRRTQISGGLPSSRPFAVRSSSG